MHAASIAGDDVFRPLDALDHQHRKQIETVAQKPWHALAAAQMGQCPSLILGSLNILPSGITDRIADIPTFFGLNLFDPRAVLLTNENFGIVDRMAHWFAAWNMFSANPWLGVGIGNYGVVYPLFGLREWPFSLGHAHNFYLNMLAETGIVGFSMYCLLIGSTLVYAWVAARRCAACGAHWRLGFWERCSRWRRTTFSTICTYTA